MDQRARLEPPDDRPERARSELKRRRTRAPEVATQRCDPASPHGPVDKWDFRKLLKDHEVGQWEHYVLAWKGGYHLDWYPDEASDAPSHLAPLSGHRPRR